MMIASEMEEDSAQFLSTVTFTALYLEATRMIDGRRSGGRLTC